MALETRLALRTTQRLVMTAMLQQAIKLLPLSRLELIQKIHQEMLENPFLDDTVELEENTTEATEEESSHETEEEPRDDSDIDWDAYFQDSDGGLAAPVDRGREAPSLEATLRHETSLTEYLIWQLSLTIRDDLDKEIGAYLLGNFDDDGYLQCQVD